MATTRHIYELAGRGYMSYYEQRRGVKPEPIPPDAIMGGYVNHHGFSDPVQVGNYVCDQADLTEYRQRTGTLPAKLVTVDYSGSYWYVHEITWTAEELAAAEVVA